MGHLESLHSRLVALPNAFAELSHFLLELQFSRLLPELRLLF